MREQKINWKKYYELLSKMEGPIMPSELPKVRIDYKGLLNNAKTKRVKAIELSKYEKDKFIYPIE